MSNILKFFLAVAVALSTLSANAQDRGYANPVIKGFHPDPSVCRVGDDFYLVTSSFQFFPGVPVYHSNDMVNWTQIGHVLDRPEQLPLKNAGAWLGIYAPTIRYNDGVYYMITTNVGNGNGESGNFFVTATDPAGPWSDPIWLKQGAIDPSFYFEGGKCYFSSNPNDGIWLCEIDPATGEQLTESRLLWTGTGGRYPEGAHIYKKDGWYYLMISEGGTEMGHKVTVARSRDIYGPYESNPMNPILTHHRRDAQGNKIQATGHADLVEAPDGSWWLVFLGFRTQANNMHNCGRETFVAPVTWSGGWPVVNDGQPVDLWMDVPTLPQVKAPEKDSLVKFGDLKSLPFEWVYLRNPHMENYRLTSNGLQLTGTEFDINTMDSPTFVSRRQEDIDFTATTTVQIKDYKKGGNVPAATGMSVYMDNHSHYDIYLSVNDKDEVTVNLEYRLYKLNQRVASVTLKNDKPVQLRVVGSDDSYDFYYSTDNGRKFEKLGELNARYLSTETAGGFTGIVLGLYAQGNCSGLFSNFDYK